MSSKSTSSKGSKPVFSADDFAKALEQHDYTFQRGQVVRGKAFDYTKDGAYIDIGGKSAAFLPTKEAALAAVTDWSEVLPLHEEREFLVIREQDENGQVTLSIRQIELKRVWDKLTQLQEDSKSFQVRVTGVNRGGVTAEVDGIRGFIPRSHLVDRDNLDALMNQTLSACVLEIDRDRNRLVLSQRLASQATRVSSLKEGDLVEGKVASLKPYGVFVDLGGVTGLLHIRQITQRRIESLDELFQTGQKIKVVIAEVDEWKSRVSLSTKVLENYPGELLEQFDEVMSAAEQRMAEKASVAAAAEAEAGYSDEDE